MQMKDALDQLEIAVQAVIRRTIAFVWSVERFPSWHVHAALVCAAPLSLQDCEQAETLWRKIVRARNKDAAQVLPYLDGICGMSYIVKELGTDIEEIQMSDHIPAYYPNSPLKYYGVNSAQRRKTRRIRKELEEAATRVRKCSLQTDA